MALLKYYKTNFDTLQAACKRNDLALLECTDAKTNKPVAVICAVHMEGEEYVMTSLAKMFDGDPYEEVNPPE